MGNAADSKRGQGNVAIEAAERRRAEKGFADALERAEGGRTNPEQRLTALLTPKSNARPLTAEQLAERRDIIADIAAQQPEQPKRKPRIITARDFIAEREAGVEPLDAIFTRDGGRNR